MEDNVTVSVAPSKQKKLQPRILAPKQREQHKQARGAIKQIIAQSSAQTDQAMADAICSLALPDGSTPIRYASRYSSAPTACAAPFKRLSYAAILDTVTTNILPASTLFGAVFRDPFRAAITYDPNVYDISDHGPQYQAVFAGTSGSGITVPLPSQGSSGAFPLPVECLIGLNAIQPHGPALFTGILQSQPSLRFIWADTNCIISTNLNNTLNTGMGLRVYYSRYSKGVFIPNVAFTDIAVGSGNASFTVPVSGYYAITTVWTTNVASPGYTASVLLELGDKGTMCHHAIPDLFNNLASVQGVRMNGLSIMYTNTSSDLNNSGRVAGLQAPQSEDWMSFAFGGFDSVAGALGATTMDVKKGMYGFLKPTQPDDYNVKGSFDYDSAQRTPIGCVFKLECDSDYLVVYPEINIQGGRDGYWSLAYTIEYLTTDVFREIAHAECPVGSYEAAIMALVTIPQWHENKTHFKDIVKKIKDFAARVSTQIQRYGPLVSGVVGAVKLASMMV